MKIKYTSLYIKDRSAHTRALKAPQIIPLVGDGPQARYLVRRGGRDTEARRIALVEARYLDWHNANGGSV